ncbi:MAG: ribosome recycling factor [Phycisphaeraceae bacterium]|nr:ribosome recycling factor [Phycisphaeraceae bacterium]
MDIDEVLLTCEESMEKAVTYLKSEVRGVRTGRASTSLIEHVKVEYYGSMTDLRQLALITSPEPTQLLVKPYDASSLQAIVKGIQGAGLGLNPMTEGKQIRIMIPSLSGERRQQLIGSVKQMGEQAKVTVRNARRDANKHVDQVGKDKSAGVSEDDVEKAHSDIQDLVKKYETMVDDLVTTKTKEIQET